MAAGRPRRRRVPRASRPARPRDRPDRPARPRGPRAACTRPGGGRGSHAPRASCRPGGRGRGVAAQQVGVGQHRRWPADHADGCRPAADRHGDGLLGRRPPCRGGRRAWSPATPASRGSAPPGSRGRARAPARAPARARYGPASRSAPRGLPNSAAPRLACSSAAISGGVRCSSLVRDAEAPVRAPRRGASALARRASRAGSGVSGQARRASPARRSPRQAPSSRWVIAASSASHGSVLRAVGPGGGQGAAQRSRVTGQQQGDPGAVQELGDQLAGRRPARRAAARAPARRARTTSGPACACSVRKVSGWCRARSATRYERSSGWMR